MLISRAPRSEARETVATIICWPAFVAGSGSSENGAMGKTPFLVLLLSSLNDKRVFFYYTGLSPGEENNALYRLPNEKLW
jgi:hypothetical protein